jgi:hypothetical protein
VELPLISPPPDGSNGWFRGCASGKIYVNEKKNLFDEVQLVA